METDFGAVGEEVRRALRDEMNEGVVDARSEQLVPLQGLW